VEINLLAMNVGNSRLALGAFAAGKLVHVTRVPHARRGDWPAAIADAWLHVSGGENAAVVGASVNPPLVQPVDKITLDAISMRVQWVGRDIEIPINVLTNPPEQTGIDRILNVAAAHEQMQKACVVVDAGTAITVNCCNDAGDFLGGAIAPGVTMMLDALHNKTAGLPRVEISVPTEVFGTTTPAAITQGVYHGIRGLVKELVERYAVELGNWPEIIATGGDAKLLFDGWELIHAIAPDLTLYGVALAYAEHHIKRGT
jgi:type III pantothenate kinase